MNITHIVIVGTLAVGVFALEARTFEVAAWRGETVAARVPDFAELGKAPDGIKVRLGVLESVKYAPSPESLQRLEVYDRVERGLFAEELEKVAGLYRVDEAVKNRCDFRKIRTVTLETVNKD